MSDTIGPIHMKERPSAELQSRIDAEVCMFIWILSSCGAMYLASY